MTTQPRPRPRPLIDGLLDAPAVHLLTSAADADLVACREAVLAAMVGSLSIGSPCLGREPDRQGGSFVVASARFADRLDERIRLWQRLTALPVYSFVHLEDGIAPDTTGARKAAEGDLFAEWSPALIVVAAGGLVLSEPATSTGQVRRIVERLRWLAQEADAAVVLDLSEGDQRVGSPEAFTSEVDAVLAIDPDRPAVQVSRSGELVATYEPALGLVGDMVAVS